MGENRGVIIVPEIALNTGWRDLALKIGRWQTRGTQQASVESANDKLVINGGAGLSKEDVLNRCLVGVFSGKTGETPSASEVRRWAYSIWPQVQVFEMGNDSFLFQFTTRKIAEHVLLGKWSWKRCALNLTWWTPVSGCQIEDINRARGDLWIRLIGLPVSLWSENVFKGIGDRCGGWLQTEEETTLKNHIKWARIRVRGPAEDIPKKITIENEGFQYKIPIWCEELPEVVCGEKFEEERPVLITQGSKDKTMSLPRSKPVLITQGSKDKTMSLPRSKDQYTAGMNSKSGKHAISVESKVVESNRFKILGQVEMDFNLGDENMGQQQVPGRFNQTSESSRAGHFSMGQLGGPNTSAPIISDIRDIVSNLLNIVSKLGEDTKQKQRQSETSGMEPQSLSTPISATIPSPNLFLLGGNMQSQNNCQIDEDAMDLIECQINVDTIGDRCFQPEATNRREELWQIEEATPIAMQTIDPQTETSAWVQKNIIELSKKYGVAFEGCEKEALALFMKIDNRKDMVDRSSVAKNRTTRGIGKNEIKNLQSSLNEEVVGTRSRGRTLMIGCQ